MSGSASWYHNGHQDDDDDDNDDYYLQTNYAYDDYEPFLPDDWSYDHATESWWNSHTGESFYEPQPRIQASSSWSDGLHPAAALIGNITANLAHYPCQAVAAIYGWATSSEHSLRDKQRRQDYGEGAALWGAQGQHWNGYNY